MNQNLYYRPNRRARKRSRRSTKKNLSYLLPFLYIAIFIFVIYALVWGVKHLLAAQSAKLSNVGVAYIAEGKAQVLLNEDETYTSLLSGQKLEVGDRLQVLKDSKVVVEFFDSTTLRLNEGSDLLFEEIDSSSNSEEIKLKLNAGELWVNKGASNKPKSTLELSLTYQDLKVSEAVFAAKSNLPEYVRVLEGKVFVDVLEAIEDKINVLDSFNLGVMQESVLTSQDYEMFKLRETPSVLADFDPDFKKEDWYKWNMEEDSNPSEFEIDPSLQAGEKGEPVSENPIDLSEELNTSELIQDPSRMEAPVVLTPEQDSVVTSDLIDITGTVPEGTQQVMVTSFEDPIPNPYVLKGFQAGDRSWKYIAAYQDGEGNLVVGENKFEIVAIDEEGKESNKAVLTFIFTPEEGAVSNSEVLEAPEIVSLDGVIIVDGQADALRNEAILQGTVGSWAKKLVVNGVELTEFVPFGNDWSYVLSTELGNLKEGANIIEVYGLDTDGVKGPLSRVTINYLLETEVE